MLLVDEPIESLAPPPEVERELAVDGVCGGDQVVEGNPPDLAQLDPADHAASEAAPFGEVDLAPAASLTERADGSTEPESIHRAIMVDAAYPALN